MSRRTLSTSEFRHQLAFARVLRLAGFAAMALFDVLLQWQQRVRQRHDLAELSDDGLKDIGLSRADVEGEVRKPFWQS